MFFILDLIGTLAFATSGALAGVSKKMDLYGVCFLAVITAVGGGTLRDVMLNRMPPFVFTDYTYIAVSLVAALIVFFFHKGVMRGFPVLLWMDAIGIGFFTTIGIRVAVESGIGMLGSIIFGVMTATFGGMMRDVLSGETPLVLKREIYASACLAGGFIYWGLKYIGVSPQVNMAVTGFIIFAIRLVAIAKNWNFPRASV